LKRLAASLDALADKDEKLLRQAEEIAGLRRKAAVQLHTVCADFVAVLNGLLSRTELRLDPHSYSAESFQDEGINLMQINARGRLVQVDFSATPELISTEDFRVPYILQGSVRCLNQKLLDQDLVQEHLLFYCLERSRRFWRYFDARTYRTGPFDQEYLISLLEQLM
jgi:hypothetical protein